MTIDDIRSELLSRVGGVGNEPAQTPIGRFIRERDVTLDDLARDLDRTEGCEDLAAEVRRLCAP